MQVIIDFIGTIGKVITVVIDFVLGFFEDLVYMIRLLGQVVHNIPSYFSWLPAEVIAILTVIIGIVVVFRILGRVG